MNGIHIETAGPASPTTSLLFMHGGMGVDHTYFRPSVDRLANEFRLVFYDHRLNGRSSRADADRVDLDTMGADGEAVAREACRGEVVLVAHSFGAWVALKLLERAPDLVSRLVLIAPGLSPTVAETLGSHVASRGSAEQQEAFRQAFTGMLQTDDDFGRAWRLTIPLHLSSHTSPEIGHQATAATHYSLLGFQRFFVAGAGRVDWETVLREFPRPVLVIAGADDWLERDPVANSTEISRVARHGTLVTIDRSGHLPFAEQPAAFCDAIRSWIHSAGDSAHR